MLPYFLGILCGYLIGSIPVAYVLVKIFKGIDVRTVGSGNVGATNAGRVLGPAGFASVLILDALKGFLPVYYSKLYCQSQAFDPLLIIFVSISLLLGHIFPIYLKFRGGKGVATGLGVFAALSPMATLIALAAFIVVLLLTRMVSAGSIAAAIVLSISVVMTSQWKGLWVFTFAACAFVIFKHRANISRIIAGTESKVKFKK